MSYVGRLKRVLSPDERRLFSKQGTPMLVQAFLDALPINFEPDGDTCMSPRLVLRTKSAHCFEGALLAATAFAYHDQRPLLMDLRATPSEDDHVVALFRVNGFWGAVSKTNHASLRYRDPVYKTIRELAMSYVHEYIGDDDKTALREYSAPFDLTRYAPEQWVVAEKPLKWLSDALDRSHHFPTVPKENLRHLRKISKFEAKASEFTEWMRPKRGKRPRRR